MSLLSVGIIWQLDSWFKEMKSVVNPIIKLWAFRAKQSSVV